MGSRDRRTRQGPHLRGAAQRQPRPTRRGQSLRVVLLVDGGRRGPEPQPEAEPSRRVVGDTVFPPDQTAGLSGAQRAPPPGGLAQGQSSLPGLQVGLGVEPGAPPAPGASSWKQGLPQPSLPNSRPHCSCSRLPSCPPPGPSSPLPPSPTPRPAPGSGPDPQIRSPDRCLSFLPCKWAHRYRLSRFCVYVLTYNKHFSLSDPLHSA